MNENTKFIHSYHRRFPRLYIWHFRSRNTNHLQLNMLLFFQPIFCNGGFEVLLWNGSKDHLGFLGYLGICFKVPTTQFTFQEWKQLEITWCEVWAIQCILHYFGVVVVKLLMHKSSCMRPSIVSMKNQPSKKFWLIPLNMIKESFQYGFVIFLTYLHFWSDTWVLVVSTRYDRGVFLIQSCNIPYLSTFLEATC